MKATTVLKNDHAAVQKLFADFSHTTARGAGSRSMRPALKCVVNEHLKGEWEEYLEQTRKHEQVVLEVMEKVGLDPETETPGREVVRHIGESLVKAMEMALEAGRPEAAQIVACECVVLAETKDHLNWELIHEVAEKSITRPAGAASYRSSPSGCLPCCHPPKKSRK